MPTIPECKLSQQAYKSRISKLPYDVSDELGRFFFEDYGLGVNIDEALSRGYLTQRELDNTARMVERSWQNWNLIGDIPAFASTNFGRFMYQFKGAAFMQSVAVKNFIISNHFILLLIF